MIVLTEQQQEAMRRRLADVGIQAPTEPTTASASPVAADGLLGIAERRMWKIYRLDPSSDAHNFTVRLAFNSSRSIESVVAATERLIESSTVIRSVIDDSDELAPRRRQIEHAGRWVAPGTRWEWGTALAEPDASDLRFATAPFALTEEPPCRVRITRTPSGVDVLLVLHHLAGDETILPPVLRALTAEGTLAGPIHQAGGTAADPNTRTGTYVEAAVRHANKTWAADGIAYPLSGELPSTTAEQSWLSVMGEGPGIRRSEILPVEHVNQLSGFAREVSATENAIFVALAALTLATVTGAHDFVLLVPADNRAAAETTDIVGYSGNIVPMRFCFDLNASVRTAIEDAVGTVYEAMEHSAVDYGTILTALRSAGGRFPVAEVMTLVKNAPLRGVPLPPGTAITCETFFTGVVHYPLSLAFEFGEDERVRLEVEYRTDILDAAYAERIVTIARALAEQVPTCADEDFTAFTRRIRASSS